MNGVLLPHLSRVECAEECCCHSWPMDASRDWEKQITTSRAGGCRLIGRGSLPSATTTTTSTKKMMRFLMRDLHSDLQSQNCNCTARWWSLGAKQHGLQLRSKLSNASMADDARLFTFSLPFHERLHCLERLIHGQWCSWMRRHEWAADKRT